MLKSDEHVLSHSCLDRIDDDINRLHPHSDRGIFASIIRRCSNAKAIEQGRRIHSHISASSTNSNDTFLLNLLVAMYGKCSRLEEARLVFDGMTQPDCFSWTIIITAYAQEGYLRHAVNLLHRMDQEGVRPNGSTFYAIASAPSIDLRLLVSIYARATAAGDRDLVLDTVVLESFSLLGALDRARSIFDSMPEKNLLSWNAMIAAYARQRDEELALQLFRAMDLEGIRHNRITYLNTISAIQSPDRANILQNRVIAAGFDGDIALRNAMVSMYSRCRSPAFARDVFVTIQRRTRVTWTAMISAYARNGHSKEALDLFFQAIDSSPPLELDSILFVSALEACANCGDLERGALIHEKILECLAGVSIDALVWNSVINMFAKCGNLEKAREIFEELQFRGLVAWNTMISSYAQAGHPAAAIEMFHRMELEGTKPDPVTFIAVLEAFGSIGSFQDGKLVHSRLKPLGFDEQDTSLCNALLNVYTNCGSMEEAIKLFQKMSRTDLISWTCAIAGYARLGHSTEAIELYQAMALEGVDPNQVTLLGVLTACKHVGLVEDGIYFYSSMVSDHSIEAKEEHYGCVVDLLARAGWIEEAEALIKSLPHRGNAVAWTALLAACCDRRDANRAERVAEEVIEKEPGDAAAYICLVNMYTEQT